MALTKIKDGSLAGSINATKLADGTVTSAELQYINTLSSNAQTQIATKSPIASPTFTGTPAVPTASAATNTTQIASTAYVRTEVANLVDSSPSALDTLNELAAALGDDASFSTTVTNSIATKSPTAGNASLVTVGTIGTGVWQGTPITSAYLNSAQTNITTLGTILTFASTGIDDNSTTNAMTIDSTEQTTFTRVGNVNDNKATLKVVPTDVHGMGISVYSNTANESNPLVQIEQGHSGGTMPALRVIQSGTAADTAWLGESGGAVVIGSNTAATVAGATDLTVGNATGAHGITILSNAG